MLYLAINVIKAGAHTSKFLATAQPRVPAPNNRHFVCASTSRFNSGTRRHFISFRFRFTEFSANLRRRQRRLLVKVIDRGRGGEGGIGAGVGGKREEVAGEEKGVDRKGFFIAAVLGWIHGVTHANKAWTHLFITIGFPAHKLQLL